MDTAREVHPVSFFDRGKLPEGQRDFRPRPVPPGADDEPVVIAEPDVEVKPRHAKD